MASHLLHTATKPFPSLFPSKPTLQTASFPRCKLPHKRQPTNSMCKATGLDPSFVVDIEHRPNTKHGPPPPTEQLEVPVIDLAGDLDRVVEEVRSACKEWGFFQVVNHGVPLHLVPSILKSSEEFFDMELEEKRKVKRDAVNPLGYHDGEHTKNVRDWKEVYDFLIDEPNLIPASPDPGCRELRTVHNPWPESPSHFRVVCQEYAGEMEKLAFKLIEIISLSLGLPADRLNGYFERQISFVRINHYPPCPFPDLTLGCGRHRDFDALTILAQDDVDGLEIKSKSDGQWVPVKPIQDAFIINVGDICQVWTNDLYKSVEHRVVTNKEKGRYSIALFFVPSHDVMVKPLEELVSQEDPAKYFPYNWGKFYATRNRSDYQKQNVDNIQIHDFRVPE